MDLPPRGTPPPTQRHFLPAENRRRGGALPEAFRPPRAGVRLGCPRRSQAEMVVAVMWVASRGSVEGPSPQRTPGNQKPESGTETYERLTRSVLLLVSGFWFLVFPCPSGVANTRKMASRAVGQHWNTRRSK